MAEREMQERHAELKPSLIVILHLERHAKLDGGITRDGATKQKTQKTISIAIKNITL